MPEIDADPAVGVAFKVRFQGQNLDLGLFTTCEGLGTEVTMEQREEGGLNGFVHQLPGRVKYGNVKLSRPINADSGKVAAWFSKMATEVARAELTITACRPDGKAVATWHLVDVVPVRWTGPSFSAETAKVATETIEMAHHGFTFTKGE